MIRDIVKQDGDVPEMFYPTSTKQSDSTSYSRGKFQVCYLSAKLENADDIIQSFVFWKSPTLTVIASINIECFLA